jgi:3-phenylpropionate/cinnamic acid dioxygenase small subunit
VFVESNEGGGGDVSDSAEHAQQITTLIHRYAECIDGGDFEGIAHLFEHATIRSGEYSFQGYETLLNLWKGMVRIYESGTPLTKHVISNVIVEVDTDEMTATGRSYVTVFQAKPPELPLQAIVSARHHDSFERVDKVWRFKERVDITDLVGDLTWHTTTPYSSEAPAT